MRNVEAAKQAAPGMTSPLGMACALLRKLRRAALVAFSAAGLLVTTALPAAGQDQRELEYAVKATFLYKFGPFVEWPDQAFDGPASPVHLCVVGRNPFGGLLQEAVAGQQIGDRPILVRHMEEITEPPDCHIIYATGSKAQPVSEVLKISRGSHILTVTDAEHSPRAHGIVHFVIQENRVRFIIDDRAASENGIVISSKLLSLALFVRSRGA